MIDLELTPEIKEWLDTPHERRDYARGALLIGKVSRNRILYANVSRDPVAKATAIEYHLRKIYSRRVADITHEQVGRMMERCDAIARSAGLDHPASGKSDFQKGKRADHDSLPQEIRDLWTRNGDLRQRMRDCHTHLRLINPSNSTCPDSDRYPWAKQLIEYDRQYRDNWNRYDHYIPGTSPAATKLAVDPRTESSRAAKTANMLLGKYARKQDPALADRIRAAYAKVISPTPALTAKMRAVRLIQ